MISSYFICLFFLTNGKDIDFLSIITILRHFLYFFIIMDWHSFRFAHDSERISKAYRGIFLELPIAVMVVACGGAVVKPWINEDVGRDVFVELEGDGIFPLNLGTLVGGVTIKAGLPLDEFRQLPSEVEGTLRTEIVLDVLALVNTIARPQFLARHISEVIGKGCHLYGTFQFVVESIDIVAHTDREVAVEWRHEV